MGDFGDDKPAISLRSRVELAALATADRVNDAITCNQPEFACTYSATLLELCRALNELEYPYPNPEEEDES